MRPSVVGLILLSVFAVLAFETGSTAASSPSGYMLDVALSDSHAGAASDVTISATETYKDRLAEPLVTYLPPDWHVASGMTIDVGAGSGSADYDMTFGLVNSPCNTKVPMHFDLMNASVDTSHTVSMNDTDNNNTPDFADDSNNNGIFDGVDRYPDFLNDLFPDTHPRIREAGITPIAGVPIMLQALIFAPGTPLFSWLDHDPSLGYPVVLLWNDMGDPNATTEPSIINDVCTPQYSMIDLGGRTNDGAQIILTNPDNLGDYDFPGFFNPLPDADGDGYENQLDTCPTLLNVGDPRITNDGDLDGDGLDAACDPNDNPQGGTNSDQDSDGYQNRDDNCPLVANGLDGKDNQLDSDGDGIGDACDPHPQTPDGASAAVRVDATAHVKEALPLRPGDVNCDGTVGVMDAFAILEYASGLQPNLPPGCPPISG
jgi:hypothetical protein